MYITLEPYISICVLLNLIHDLSHTHGLEVHDLRMHKIKTSTQRFCQLLAQQVKHFFPRFFGTCEREGGGGRERERERFRERESERRERERGEGGGLGFIDAL
jgi:hypothetical protein